VEGFEEGTRFDGLERRVFEAYAREIIYPAAAHASSWAVNVTAGQ
jgi:hypothetical protein